MDLVEKNNVQLSVLLYVATNHAKSHLENEIIKWLNEHNHRIIPNIFVVQELHDEISNRLIINDLFTKLLEKYFDDSIVDKHFKR